MYAISNAPRVYIALVLFLCSSFFLAPTLANAADGYWSTQERRFVSQSEVNRNVQRILDTAVNKPSGSTLGVASSAPTISKNAAGGLSATTNNILKTLDQPSNFTATSNYSAASAKNALKSCVRSPACAGRAFGAGAVIYEGILGWKSVYGILFNESTNRFEQLLTNTEDFDPSDLPDSTVYLGMCSNDRPPCVLAVPKGDNGPPYIDIYCNPQRDPSLAYIGGMFPSPAGSSNPCVYVQQIDIPYVPLPDSKVEQYIDDSYSPEVSDAPIVLLSGEPETITLTEPQPANLPSTTTTNTDSQGKTTTTVKNSVITYNILNNNSSSPSIESVITESSNTYDDTANLVGSMTSTTTNNPVAPDPVTSPNAGASSDFELPVFCTWAKPLCDWLNWTQEPLEDEEPDIIDLISEFEPDESQYNSGIGSGSCPAPMSLNLGIINRVVEVSYQPFCDFLDMIRPLVIAGAWLLSAFMYVGVLRRG